MRDPQRRPPALFVFFASALLQVGCATPGQAAQRQSNVLFIVVDNMRPSLGAYGHKDVLSPHIDGLAHSPSGATLFSRAYCQEAWCSPSRNSFLSGRRPDKTQTWNFRTSFREAPGGQGWTTLPGHFKQQGYFTAASGKVFHPNFPPLSDFPRSWSLPAPNFQKYDCDFADGAGVTHTNMTCSFSPGDGHPDADKECADATLNYLDTWQSNFSSRGTPFFVAAGFQSPRLSWSYPQSVAKRYPPVQKTAITQLVSAPRDGSLALEWFRPVEIDWYTDVETAAGGAPTHAKPLSDAMQRLARHAYYCAITHVDDQVGRLLEGLKERGLFDDTVVVLTADHGQNLGELGMWSMMNLLETSLRVPLIIKPVASDGARVQKTYTRPVELLDLFSTVAALAHVAPPPSAWGLPGTDLSLAMRTGAAAKPLDAAFSQITRCHNCSLAYGGDKSTYENGCRLDAADAIAWTVPCAQTPSDKFDWMGMSVRKGAWRYSVWCKWQPALRVDWTVCRLPELYNHTLDTALFDVENPAFFTNVAGKPASATVQNQMHALLRKGFA